MWQCCMLHGCRGIERQRSSFCQTAAFQPDPKLSDSPSRFITYFWLCKGEELLSSLTKAAVPRRPSE